MTQDCINEYGWIYESENLFCQELTKLRVTQYPGQSFMRAYKCTYLYINMVCLVLLVASP